MKINALMIVQIIIILSCVVLFGWIDWITGYELNIFVLYFLPVAFSAWLTGIGFSIAVSILSAMIWFYADVLSGHTHSSHIVAVWNTLILFSSFLSIGWAIHRIRQSFDRERKLTDDLQGKLSEIRVLEGILPICCQCKKIRDNEGHWRTVEDYISRHSDTKFSHGYCTECYGKAMQDISKYIV